MRIESEFPSRRFRTLLADGVLLTQALLFDRKRGVQSIGAGVRDSAAYVLWSLARTLRPSQISAEAANQLATRLVSVALYDRDIHIRRAASAAFQESVGRWVSFSWDSFARRRKLIPLLAFTEHLCPRHRRPP